LFALPPPLPLRRVRNPQPLARIDLVGVLQHRLVGLEDLGVLVGVAVVVLGDLGERVAGLHLIEDGFRLRSGHAELIVDTADALDVADQEDDLLLVRLGVDAARDRHLVTVDQDAELVDLEAHVGDQLGQRAGAPAVHHVLHLLGSRSTRCGCRRRSRLVVSKAQLPAHTLREINQTHGQLLLVAMGNFRGDSDRAARPPPRRGHSLSAQGYKKSYRAASGGVGLVGSVWSWSKIFRPMTWPRAPWRSSSVAWRTPSTLPNVWISSLRRRGPMPERSSSRLCRVRAERRARCRETAKRCASSRICCSSRRPWSSRGSLSGSGRSTR